MLQDLVKRAAAVESNMSTPGTPEGSEDDKPILLVSNYSIQPI